MQVNKETDHFPNSAVVYPFFFKASATVNSLVGKGIDSGTAKSGLLFPEFAVHTQYLL